MEELLSEIDVFVGDANICLESNVYSCINSMNIEVPLDLTNNVNHDTIKKIVTDSLLKYIKKTKIPVEEIFLVKFFFSCKTELYVNIKKSFPEFFV